MAIQSNPKCSPQLPAEVMKVLSSLANDPRPILLFDPEPVCNAADCTITITVRQSYSFECMVELSCKEEGAGPMTMPCAVATSSSPTGGPWEATCSCSGCAGKTFVITATIKDCDGGLIGTLSKTVTCSQTAGVSSGK
jgi:hypothetical protein